MRCPHCHEDDTRVIESRSTEGNEVIRRRRECTACSHRFTTYERLEQSASPMVVKSDGRLEAFDREKLFSGIKKACDKLEVPYAKLDELAKAIEAAAKDAGALPTKEVGNLVMEGLKEINKVAYVRFAAVYRRYETLDELEQVIRQLNQEA